jgi:hypothetical protein
MFKLKPQLEVLHLQCTGLKKTLDKEHVSAYTSIYVGAGPDFHGEGGRFEDLIGVYESARWSCAGQIPAFLARSPVRDVPETWEGRLEEAV